MLQNESNTVRSLAKRLSGLTKSNVVLERMTEILRDSSRTDDQRIGYYVPNVGFVFSSVVKGEPSCVVELTQPVHTYMLGLMKPVDTRWQPFILIKIAHSLGALAGTLTVEEPQHVEGQMVSIKTLKIDCRPIDVVYANIR